MNYQNTRALALWGNYLNERAGYIRPDEVDALTDLGLSAQQAVAQLVACACGLDVENNPKDKELFHTYFLPIVKELSVETYRQDAYYTRLLGCQGQAGAFCLTEQKHQPYECFVRNDLITGSNAEVLPQIGFFAEEFIYPAVLENGRIWMSITPNEIETMRGPLSRARGRVLTYGLGLGYFAFHASEKETVEQVTVVERNPQALTLFADYLLPFFSHPEKICLKCADAFEVASAPAVVSSYDYVFADIWRDVSDGLTLYKRLKALEPAGIKTKFDYWIEPTLRFYL